MSTPCVSDSSNSELNTSLSNTNRRWLAIGGWVKNWSVEGNGRCQPTYFHQKTCWRAKLESATISRSCKKQCKKKLDKKVLQELTEHQQFHRPESSSPPLMCYKSDSFLDRIVRISKNGFSATINEGQVTDHDEARRHFLKPAMRQGKIVVDCYVSNSQFDPPLPSSVRSNNIGKVIWAIRRNASRTLSNFAGIDEQKVCHLTLWQSTTCFIYDDKKADWDEIWNWDYILTILHACRYNIV